MSILSTRHPALPVLETSGSGASKRGSHQLADALTCPRKWYLRYRKGLREVEDQRFRISGTLHHYSIAYAYAERVIERGIWPIPTWWTGESLDDGLARIGEGWPQLVRLAREMYDAYRERYWDCEPWEPVAVEEQFWSTLGDMDPQPGEDPHASELITCNTDLVVRNTDTKLLWIVDNKSKGFDPFYRSRDKRMVPWERDGEQYAIDWQVLVNLHLVRRAFPDEVVAGFIINRFTRDKPFLFDRHALHVSPRTYAMAPSTMRHAAMAEREIDGTVAAGGSPQPHYWACHGKYGHCDYVKLCNAEDEDQVGHVLSSEFRVVD